MRQRADFHTDGMNTQPTDPAAPLRRLMAEIGTGTREALWAVQLIERKAAVARWRAGPLAHNGRPLRGTQERPS